MAVLPGAMAVLRATAESGVTFFDTADVYGDGRRVEDLYDKYFRAQVHGRG